MTFPGGITGDNPRDEPGATQSEGGYEAPPIEKAPQSNFEISAPQPPPPPGYPAGYPAPPGHPGGYPPPPPPPGSPTGYQTYPPPVGWGTDGQPVAAGTNGLAIASLVCSVIGVLCGIGSLIGVVLGFIAINQIKQTGQRGYGLAVAGIVVGAASMVIYLIWMITLAMT